jgi:hypothetical protein
VKTLKTIVGVYAKYLVPILLILALILPFVIHPKMEGVSYGAVPAYKELVYQGGTANLSSVNITALNVKVAGSGNFTNITAAGVSTFSGLTTFTANVTTTNVSATNATITTISGSPAIASPALSGTVTGAPTFSGLTTFTANVTTANLTATNLTVTTILSGATVTSPSVSSPTITGTATNSATNTFSGLTTFTANVTTTNITAAVLTVTGTPIFANHASGSANFTASLSSLVVAHGMSGTPTRIFLQPKGALGTTASSTGANNPYWGSANTTSFTISTVVTTNTTTMIDWLAFIADE